MTALPELKLKKEVISVQGQAPSSSASMIGSRLGDERSVGRSVPILLRPWRHLSRISKLIEA